CNPETPTMIVPEADAASAELLPAPGSTPRSIRPRVDHEKACPDPGTPISPTTVEPSEDTAAAELYVAPGHRGTACIDWAREGAQPPATSDSTTPPRIRTPGPNAIQRSLSFNRLRAAPRRVYSKPRKLQPGSRKRV